MGKALVCAHGGRQSRPLHDPCAADVQRFESLPEELQPRPPLARRVVCGWGGG
jgi:hypothetical protein